MFTVYKKEFEWGGRTLTIETGKVARQADGSVMVTYGDTQVLATACFAKTMKAGQDFFPLTVNYQEKYYAAGKIPGGFFRREGRPTEKETLTSRLIDRPLRPLFPKEFKNETQVVLTVMSSDGDCDPEVPALIAASAALTLSGIPFLGPIGAAQVAYIDGNFILNPSPEQYDASDLRLSVAGTSEGVTMVESQVKELSEDTMLDAVMFAHDAYREVIDAIIELAEAAAKPGYVLPEKEDTSALEKDMQKAFGKGVVKAYSMTDKMDRQAALNELRDTAKEQFGGENGEHKDAVKALFKSMEASVLRGELLENQTRVDGRKTDEIRNIVSEVDVLHRAHGSALFTRGETQAIVATTLGTGRDEQIIDGLNGDWKDAFMLHYNFPPYSVGECGRMGGTNRREYGHGKLARRALEAVLPTGEDFPYTIRVVSEITESNGSSSMASVCGASLSMMAAGVPLTRPVAGIAMGLIKEGEKYEILSDILGDEDHLGDMDFKVAGTSKGITALQMDIKITSITKDIMKEALAQAHGGRMHILAEMAKTIEASREDLADYAPQMKTIMIPTDKIREVIGTGGKVIRGLIEETGCAIDIDDTGMCKVSSSDREALDNCVAKIEGILAVAEAGKTYTGKAVRLTDFGAFVSILPNQDGLVHISEIADVRLGSVEEVLVEGDDLTVKCVEVDDRGKVRLTMKGIKQNADVQKRVEAAVEKGDQPRKPRDDNNRGGKGGRDRRPRRSA